MPIQDHTPALDQLIVGNKSLRASWTQDPYVNVTSAFLVLSSSTNMIQIPVGPYDLSFNITGLTNGTKYSVSYVETVGINNYVSNTMSATPGSVPNHLTLNTLTPINKGAIANITIGNTEGYAVSHVIFFIFDTSTNILAVPPVTKPYIVDNNDYDIDPLDNFALYDVAFVAINERGQSEFSNSVQVEPTNLPNAPTLRTVQSGENGQSSIAWQKSSNIGRSTLDAYYIYQAANTVDGWGNVQVGQYFQVGTLNVTPSTPDASLNFIATGLTNGVLYSFMVSAYDAPYGEGAKSNSMNGLPYVSASMNGFAITPGNTSLQTNWSSATNQQFYNLSNPVTYILDCSGSSGVYSGSNLSYNITGLTNGLPYNVSLKGTYQIPQALFETLDASSNIQTVTGPSVARVGIPMTVPDAPPSISITAVAQSISVMTLNWTAPSNNGGAIISSYNVNRYLDASCAVLDASVVNIQALELTMTGLSAVPYWFKVFALNAAGISAPGQNGPFTPSNNISPPTLVSLVQTGTTADNKPILQLSWTSTNSFIYTTNQYSVNQCDKNGIISGSDYAATVPQSPYDSSFNDLNGVTQYNYIKGNIIPDITSSANYYVKIKATQNATNTTPSYTSDVVQVSVSTGTLPAITDISFDVSNNNVNFTVDANGSALISLLVLAPPSAYVVSPVPYQLVTTDATLDDKEYSVHFGYTLASPDTNPPQQFYLISATNSVGCVISQNFA
jgi:hypothetical protein